MATDVKKIMGDFLAAWNSHDVNKILSYFNDDGIFEDVATGIVKRGKEEISDYLNTMFVDTPDFKFEEKSVFGTGDWMGVEAILSGTHAHSSMPGIPATGKKFSVRCAGIYQLSKGKISRKSVYMNMTTMLQQLGLMPGQPK